MKNIDATETAYKNGYEAGKRDAIVHGTWEILAEWCCVCSVCHKSSIQDYYFCPNCGAKMGGE